MIRLFAAFSVTALLLVGFLGAGAFVVLMSIGELKSAGFWDAAAVVFKMLFAIGFGLFFGVLGPYELYWKKERKHAKESANIIFGFIALMAIGAGIFGSSPLTGVMVWLVGAGIGYWAALRPIDWQSIKREIFYLVAALSVSAIVLGTTSMTFGMLNRPENYSGRRLIELARVSIEPTSIEREFLISTLAIVAGSTLLVIGIASAAILSFRRARPRDA